jgi:hypothetical protein
MSTPRPASDWSSLRRQDIDAAEPLTLFDIEGGATTVRTPDRCGTPDLFAAVADPVDTARHLGATHFRERRYPYSDGQAFDSDSLYLDYVWEDSGSAGLLAELGITDVETIGYDTGMDIVNAYVDGWEAAPDDTGHMASPAEEQE